MPQPDVTNTQAFAHRLKEATTQAQQQARDDLIAEMYGAQGIQTYAQYQDAVRQQQNQQQAQQYGIDPALYGEIVSLKDKVSQYEQQSAKLQRQETLIAQDSELSNDPAKGSLYKTWKPEISQVADQFNVDYQTAFAYVLANHLPEVMKNTATTAQQDAISKIAGNGQSTPGSLSSGADKPNASVWDMSTDDFQKMQERALRGDLKQ